jgi:hypothetical protein
MSTARFRCDACSVISDFPMAGPSSRRTTRTHHRMGQPLFILLACRPRRADLVAWLEQTGSLYWFIQFSYMGS